ncbi:MAG: riboflavin biosynthesis protein RibF [Bacteroidales bacterium]|nr:riboflavin biosynthesis protein RibF [Bacteroidales bacterium]
MAVVATGFFDGVHIGHRLVLDTLVETARVRGEQSVVITFWPHPRIVLQDDALGLRLLNTSEEKVALLRSLGVDRVEVLPFTKEFSMMGAEEYMRDYVKGRFGGTAMLLGYDNRIGHEPLTPAQTQDVAARLGLEVIRTDKVSSVGIAVSSTKIRAALASGDVALASRFLCYDYSISGEVVHGKKLGRTIGFPTANISPDPLKLIPAEGVYSSRVRLGSRLFHGMTNIAYDGGIETHIFDFDEDIYGHTISVEFVSRIRGEKNFSSLEELKNQLREDEMKIKLIFDHENN